MKKLLRFAGVALLALTVGCDDDEVVTPVAPVAPPTPAPIFGTVSGTVSVEGSGLVGVSVSLSGAASQSASTGSSGGYSFTNVPAGTHSVQISGAPADVDFPSTATAVTITTSGQTATADFSGTYIRTSTITGSITAGGKGVVATVTATRSGMLMSSEQPVVGSSDTDGNFELTGLRAGTYHVAISDLPEGIEFLVTMRDVTVGVGLPGNVSFNALGEDGPTTGTDPFRLITAEVTDGTDDNDKISGHVTVKIDVERGEFEKIALYVDGAEVDAQLFGFGPAPAEDPPVAAQQVGVMVMYSLSFNSAEYDPDTGEVTYPNGAHEIVAGVTVRGSTEEAYSNRIEVEFDNPDGVLVATTAPSESARASDGGVWYGGPGTTLEITAITVAYSGSSVDAVTMLGFCGADAASDDEAPYEFAPDCAGKKKTTPDATPQFSAAVAGAAVDLAILNQEDDLFPINLDYAGPTAPVFRVNPGDPARQFGWINAAVDLVSEYKSSNKNGWLTYYDDDDDGVGGYIPQLRYATSDPSVVASARAAAASADPALPAVSKKDRICFIVTAMDRLGNESALPSASNKCVNAEEYADLAATLKTELDADDPDADDVAAARKALREVGLRGGVDVTIPTAEFARSGLDEGARELDEEFVVDVVDEDDGSGINEDDPFIASLTIRDAEDTKCIIDGKPSGSTRLCSDPFAGLTYDDGLVSTTGLDGNVDYTGYYTFTGQAQDRAGNLSAEISRVALSDGTFDARASLRVRGDRDDPYDYTVDITVDDDLSVRDYYLTVSSILEGGTTADVPGVTSGTAMTFLMGDVEEVDAYNAADPLTTDYPVSEDITLPFLALQDDAGGTLTTFSSFDAYVRDQRAAESTDDADARDGFTAAAKGTGADDGVTIAIAADETGTSDAELDDGDDIKFTVMVGVVDADDDITRQLDETDPPFKRIYLYAESSADNDGPKHWRLIDSFAKTAYDEGATGNPEFVYEVEINAGDLFNMVDDDGKGDYSGRIIAIGVQNDLEALDAIVASNGPDGEANTDDDIEAATAETAKEGVGLVAATAVIFIDP